MNQELRTYEDAARAGDNAAAEYGAQATELRTERDRARSRRREVQAGITEQIKALVALLLPSYSKEACEQASTELGAIGMPDAFRRLEADRKAKRQRLDEVNADPYYDNGNERASITRREGEVDTIRRDRDAAKRIVDEMDDDDDLMRRYVAKDLPKSGDILDILLKIILIGFILDWLEAGKVKRLLDVYDAKKLEDIYTRYDEAKATVRRLNTEVGTKATELRRIRELSTEHDRLVEELDGFEERALEKLRESLRGSLGSYPAESWKNVRAKVRSDARIAVTTLIVQLGKVDHLQTLENKLGEESRKLSERASKLREVARKWRRRPSYELDQDLSGRLIDGPRRMRRRTNMFVRSSTCMSDVIWYYDDYTALDFMLEMGTDYLLWDVMVGGYAEPILFPDAFAIYMFDEIADWRDEHGEPEYTQDTEAPSALDVPEPGGDFEDTGVDEPEFDPEDFDNFTDFEDSWDDGDDGWDSPVEPEPEPAPSWGGGGYGGGNDEPSYGGGGGGWDSGGSDYDSGGYDDGGGWDD